MTPAAPNLAPCEEAALAAAEVVELLAPVAEPLALEEEPEEPEVAEEPEVVAPLDPLVGAAPADVEAAEPLAILPD